MAQDDLGAGQQQAWPSADPPARLSADPAADAPTGAAPVALQAPPTPYPSQPPQGPYPTQGYYPPPGYYAQPPTPSTPVLPIVGFALAFIVPPVGVILSIVALVLAWRGGKGSGRGLAIGGIAAGAIITLLAAAAVFSVVLTRERDEAEVRGAFEGFAQALVNGDCDAYMASTTPAFRKQLGVASCARFADVVVPAGEGPVGIGAVPITDVDVHRDTATLSTIENLGLNWRGGPTIQSMDYSLVRIKGTWLVDGFAFGD